MTDDKLRGLVEFAIGKEREAAELYEKYAGIVTERTSQTVLGDMARMERGHEDKLKAFAETGKASLAEPGSVTDLKISDYLVEPTLSADSDIADVFVFAMKAEQKAYELYSWLARTLAGEDGRNLFETLAAEEQKHKLSLEDEYEAHFMKDN